MFSREHASFHYLLTNIRVDGTSSLLEGWTRNTSAPSAFSARGNHTRLVVATGRLNFAPSQPQRLSTLICLFFRFCQLHFTITMVWEIRRVLINIKVLLIPTKSELLSLSHLFTTCKVARIYWEVDGKVMIYATVKRIFGMR